jgi:hypothetical protein
MLSSSRAPNHASPLQTNDLATYTYISYVCADNNLQSYGRNDVNEMETGYNDSVTNVHVISLLDLYYGGTSAYYISHDENEETITSTILNIEGLSSEVNMGDPETLITYVNWCMTYYPAEHYILDLWDHGSGWAVCFDDSSGGDALTMAELRYALDTINTSTGNTVDILCMDACLMGTLEVAYEIRDYASIFIASEDSILAVGFPYDTMIDDICERSQNPTQNLTDLAATMVDLFAASLWYYRHELAAINLTILETTLSPSFSAFAQNLHSYLDQGIKNEIYNARGATEEFYYPEYIDLYDFAQKLKAEASNSTIQGLAQVLMDNLSQIIINERHHQNPEAHGLSIYCPEIYARYDSDYATFFSLSNETLWDDFLVKYYTIANFGLDLRYFSLNDTLGDNDSTPDPGETLSIEIILENIGDILGININGTLVSSDMENATVLQGFNSYGAINIGSSGSGIFQFNISTNASLLHALPFVLMTETIFSSYSVHRNFTFELIVGLKITLGGSTLQTATEISVGYTYGLLPGPGCDSETWLKINSTTHSFLFLNLTGPEYTDFDAYIYGPNEALVSLAAKPDYPDECSVVLLQSGYYYIKLDPFSGSGYYSIFLNFTTEAYEDGSFFGLAITLPNRNSTTGTLPGPGTNGYFYYRVFVQKNQELHVSLTGPGGSDFDLYVYNPALELVDKSISPQSSESCYLAAKTTGFFYIIIVPYLGTGEFTLQVKVQDLSIPVWLLILLISLVALSVAAALIYYFKIVRRSRDPNAYEYDIQDVTW